VANPAAGFSLRGVAKAECHPMFATVVPPPTWKNRLDREPSRGSILTAVKIYYPAQAAGLK
jgi:hypothetical protein